MKDIDYMNKGIETEKRKLPKGKIILLSVSLLFVAVVMFSLVLNSFVFPSDNDVETTNDNPTNIKSNYVKEFDEQTNTVSIEEDVLFGDKLLDVKLEKNTYECGTECYAIWNVTIYKDEDQIFLNNLEFKKIDGKGIKDSKFEYVSGYEEIDVPDYVINCKIRDENNYCTQVQSGSHKEYKPIYETFNPSRKLPVGNYVIKLTGYKDWGTTIDWIPTYYGKEVKEWAYWASSPPTTYYKFNENNFTIAGNMQLNDTLGLKNLSITSTGSSLISAKLGNGISLKRPINDIIANTTGGNEFAFDTGAFTIAFWFNISAPITAYQAVTTDQSNSGWGIDPQANGTIKFSNSNVNFGGTSYSVSNGTWQRVIFTREGTGAGQFRTWVNGTNVNNHTLSANISNNTANFVFKSMGQFIMWDDFQIYKGYAFTASDVNFDWNNGVGREANISILEISNNLSSPLNGISTIQTSINFSANHTALNGNLTNATLYVWNSSGGIFNTNSITINGIFNETNLTISSLIFGNYEWNYLTCGSNATTSLCKMTQSNRTFTISGFESNTENYSFNVYETQNQLFQLNISTVPSILDVNAYLNYNGTRYFANTECNSGECNINRNIDIPLVTAGEEQNKSFLWEISTFDGTSTSLANTSSNQQNVSRIHLELSNVTYTNTALNFTTWEEQNRTRLNPMSFVSTFNVWLGNGTVQRNVSFNVPMTNSTALGIKPHNYTFTTNAIIEYNAVGQHSGQYQTRNYYFQQGVLTNETQNIKLFLLNTTDSTSFIQRVIGLNQIGIEKALIFQQRYYPEDDTYETVSISKTDEDGKSIGFYEVEIPNYRHIITKNGTILKTTEQGKIFPEFAPFTLTFIIGEATTYAWESFSDLSNLFSNLSYNKDLDLVTYTWIDTSGSLSIANLTVLSISPNSLNTPICSKSSVLGAGTLNCNVTGYNGTMSAQGYIGRSPQVLDKLITFTKQTLIDSLSNPFLLLWIFFLMIGIGAGVFYPPAGIIITLVIMVIGMMLQIVNISWIFVWAMVAVGLIILAETRE